MARPTRLKEIAAVFYGVGARLDTRPELLFLLRGVEHTELAAQGGVDTVIDKGRGAESELAGADLSELFGIELVDCGMEVPSAANAAPQKSVPAKTTRQRQVKKAGVDALDKTKVKKKSGSAAPSKSKTKTAPRSTASKRDRSIIKSDVERLEKVLRLAKTYAAEKKEKATKKAVRKKGGKQIPHP